MNIQIPQPRLLPHRAAGPAIALTVAVLLTLAIAGCGSQAAPHAAPPPPQVSVAPVVSQSVKLWDEYTGRITAVETVELRPRVTGYIDKVAFDEGEFVEKGDLLFAIDPRVYQAELERAEAMLAQARSEARLAQSQLERAQQLIEAKAISRETLDSRNAAAAQGNAAVAAAEAAVASARLDLKFSQVRAPISGIAGRALVTAGNLAQADSTVLTTLVSIDPMHVHFAIDEQSALRYAGLEDGVPVRIGLADEEGYPHAAKLDFVDNHVDPDTGTVHARAVLPNAEHAFKPGLFARVQLLGAQREQALLVDPKAVLTDQDRQYVYVLGKDNQAQRKDVVLGPQVGELRVVSSGLAAGDRVIVHGVQKVFFPGMPVQPQMIAMGEPPAPAAAANGASAAGVQ